mmetsp:Transcript_8889/g.14440  ORF Transcript_8889/g.14440 Transcript_8889/m.14440 type:complete len:437 (-) Transcript_8889:1390-2700(-)
MLVKLAAQVDEHLCDLRSRYKSETGLLVGSYVPQDDSVIVCVAIPSPFEAAADRWFCLRTHGVHASFVQKMLVGGLEIVGFYACSPLDRHNVLSAANLIGREIVEFSGKQQFFALHQGFADSKLVARELAVTTSENGRKSLTGDVSPASFKVVQDIYSKFSRVSSSIGVDFSIPLELVKGNDKNDSIRLRYALAQSSLETLCDSLIDSDIAMVEQSEKLVIGNNSLLTPGSDVKVQVVFRHPHPLLNGKQEGSLVFSGVLLCIGLVYGSCTGLEIKRVLLDDLRKTILARFIALREDMLAAIEEGGTSKAGISPTVGVMLGQQSVGLPRRVTFELCSSICTVRSNLVVGCDYILEHETLNDVVWREEEAFASGSRATGEFKIQEQQTKSERLVVSLIDTKPSNYEGMNINSVLFGLGAAVLLLSLLLAALRNNSRL